ncbi:hypothetical protein [Limosilactobacillus antri]|uniref:hypothetical protein n=1 Tax=Limosilactobacillus antri TaxID=227943 RepID=UPI001F573FDD|nr:hypothetical protein [Limosilactobacillus antri]
MSILANLKGIAVVTIELNVEVAVVAIIHRQRSPIANRQLGSTGYVAGIGNHPNVDGSSRVIDRYVSVVGDVNVVGNINRHCGMAIRLVSSHLE